VPAEELYRPIGFRPSEISASVNEPIVARHADEAPFLWTTRARATDEPHYSLDDLAKLDERLEAHLEGLRVGEDFGWQCCKRNLDSFGAGEAFVLAILAFGGGNRERIRDAILVGCTSPHVRRGLISALAWLGNEAVKPWIRLLLEAKSSEYRLVGIAAMALQRQDLASWLQPALRDHDPALRARALRAVGECKRIDLLDLVGSGLDDVDDECRFSAAWTLTLLGDEEGLAALLGFVDEGAPYAVRAAQLGLRAAGLERSRNLVSALAARAGFERLAVIATGAIGDPQSVPWIIDRMQDPSLARLAGEAFATITGADLIFEDLNLDAGPTTDDEVSNDATELLSAGYEANLPLPHVAKVQEWWVSNRKSFVPGQRYLSGGPIEDTELIQILFRGKQRRRAAAAFELALLHRNGSLFNVRARGREQKERLLQWIS
jgi:uncharacterized protein (TIGR02270 family)